ncbi:hypothetical protein X801_03182 [Opisthorchis viverrini]|uniref:Uncharacterized protein n=2 Tax=Opisthorchis viverrini TaxID=6198 RepID=A0A074ZCM2_OPIVI|nr:hypothetical protein T265_14290 [Opisthorchis viverrini]KER25036.1 hypothetical protein T265_14290 [Opisthorchis viverrini]OON20924.1 hypothetical protein X801_03182 [Opisthorchis viverrini]
MDEDAEDLFVIDKSGVAQSSQLPRIIYDPTVKEDLSEVPTPATERSAAPARPRRPVTGKRYHEVEDFSKFRPGLMSDKLRHALNLAAHEIPIHIYRMRTLGYPPGWLRKARVGGELTMFDSVAALAEDTEVKYNRDLLVSFMGFNTQIEYPYIDECDVLNCPRMQSHHMLDNFYAALSRSSRLSSEHNNENPSLAGTVASNTSNGKNDDGGAKDKSSDRSNSQILLISASEDGTPTPSRPSGMADGSNADGASSSAKRPNIDAFSVGVQPFRPFENLPGTEGAYKRVLQTLRNSRNGASVNDTPSASRDSNHSASGSNASFKTSTPHRRSHDQHSTYNHPYSRSPHMSRRYR